MPWLICYDIEQDNLRSKVAKRLLYEGLDRLQWSVFAGDMTDHQLTKLKDWLKDVLTKHPSPGNSIIILNLPPSDLEGMTVFGEPKFDFKELTDPPNTIFF